MIAMMTAASNVHLAGLVLISASDHAAEAVNQHEDGTAQGTTNQTPCSAPLSGCTNEGLDLEVLNHASNWTFAALARTSQSCRC
jgi:hypothetical protein